MSVGLPPAGSAVVGLQNRLRSAQATAAEPQAWLAVRAGILALVATAVLDAFSHELSIGYQLLWAAEISFMLLVGGIALWLGDQPARWTGLAVVLGQLAQTLLQSSGARTSTSLTFSFAKASHLLSGIALLLIVIAIALRWPRPWLLWACAFQLAYVATFVAAMLDLSIRPLAFVTAANTWMLLGGAALLWGALERRPQRPHGRRVTSHQDRCGEGRVR